MVVTRALRVFLAVWPLLFLTARATGERLPIRTYTSADGLAHERVKQIVRDPVGFLWFCTPGGISRFDGERFTTYGSETGLPHSSNDLLVTRDGDYWIATNGGGVARLRNAYPKSFEGDRAPRFSVYPVGPSRQTNRVNVLYEDRAGRLWAGTDGGLFELAKQKAGVTFSKVLPIALAKDGGVQVFALLEDGEGSLWIGTTRGLARRLPDGRIVSYRPRSPHVPLLVYALLQDSDRRLWVGHSRGLIVMIPEPASAFDPDDLRPVRDLPTRETAMELPRALSEMPAKPGQNLWCAIGADEVEVRALHRASDRRIWIGTTKGLVEVDGNRSLFYGRRQGLPEDFVIALNEDRDGNLWLGSYASGAMKVARNGFVSFDEADGLPDGPIISLIETRAGDLCAVGSGSTISRFDGKRFLATRPNVPVDRSSFGRARQVLEDHFGEWWVATAEGLYRFPPVRRPEALARATPLKVYASRDGLPGDDIRELFEDSRGDLWVGTAPQGGRALSRWARATGRFHTYVGPNESTDLGGARAFGEDRGGNLWIAFREARLARYRDGDFRVFGPGDGLPAGDIMDLHLDRSGRLWVVWIATREGGMSFLDPPQADPPRFSPYTTAGVAVAALPTCVAEDDLGRLYLGTTKGVDRLDPGSHRLRHFTAADGLPPREILSAYRDRNGALWFGTAHGLSRFIPAPERASSAPPVWIGGLRVGGSNYSVSELGETMISGIEVAPDRSQVQVDFFGLAFAPGERLRYQYELEGADRTWNAPTEQRSINYARLSPGTYRFRVRAINSDGLVSAEPASIAFTVLSPIWMRWWFLLIGGGLVVLVAYSGYRFRLGKLLELERVRTRIASDLHDEIGSSLSKIAIVSEVLRRRIPDDDPALAESLSAIAAGSRESVDSMSDIVWAVDPRRDSVQQLSRRMRRFASDVLAVREIRLDFDVPEDDRAIPLGAEIRREILRIFKEAVNNIARHSDCGRASVRLELQDGSLYLTIADDGRGFDPLSAGDGLGLTSMTRRAERVGGELRIESHGGGGTTVRLRVPVGRYRLVRRGFPPIRVVTGRTRRP